MRAEKVSATAHRAIDRESGPRTQLQSASGEPRARTLDTFDTETMTRLHNVVSERVFDAPTSPHWYHKGAVELRLAQLTSDKWRVREAVISFSRASRALSQAPESYRLSAEGQAHHANIDGLMRLAFAFHGKR